jgi:hypothetical protein
VIGTAEATINAIQFREARVVGQSNRPSPSPQSLRNLLRQLKKGTERWSEHPLAHETPENLRQLAKVLRAPPPPSAPSKQKQRKGQGRPGKLSADTIVRLQQAYQKRLKARPKFAVGERACKFLRRLLPESERGVSNRTLYRCIINPVRNDKNRTLTK